MSDEPSYRRLVVCPGELADAIGEVLRREERAMRKAGYTSVGPEVALFDLFARFHSGPKRNRHPPDRERLAALILDELAER